LSPDDLFLLVCTVEGGLDAPKGEVEVGKKFVFLCLFVALASCAADVRENEAEAVGQARGELNLDVLKGLDIDVMTSEERQKWLEERRTSWNAYLLDAAHPDLLIVFKEKDKDDKKKWIFLDPKAHWKRGDAYFWYLMKEARLTPLDFVGISGALQRAGGKPPLLPSHHMMLDPGCIGPECGGYGSSGPSTPWTLGGDHTGPGPGNQPPSSGGSGVSHPPPGGPPHRGGSTPDELKKWRDGIEKQRAEQQRLREELENGVPKDALPALPSPRDATYKPGWGEHKERYMCEGTVYFGYRSGCIDFQNVSASTKLATKIGNFFQQNADAFHRYIFHNVWNDGKNPQCMRTCTTISSVDCIGIGGALWLVCIGVTDGLCAAGAVGAAAGSVFASLSPAVCAQKVQDYCTDNICIRE
jgi:hypothetical protein